MTVQTGGYLKGMFDAAKAMGDKAVSSDSIFEIKGSEELSLLIKQFPWPELSPAGEIEVAGPLGMASWQPQQIKVNQQGQITFMETTKGHIADFMEKIIASGGKFDAVVYEGSAENPARVCPIYDCFVQLDNPDRDWENRSQIVLVSGTLFFHYFGAKK